MLNPARPQDLLNLGVQFDDADVAQERLNITWRALKRAVPDLVSSLEAGRVDRDDVIDVIRAATMRVLKNPDGVESEQGGIDDYTEAVKYADATEDVYFTAAELRRLRPDVLVPPGFSGSLKYNN